MQLFDVWWQAIAFGLVTTIALLVVANFFHVMWEKYQDKPQNRVSHNCADDHL